MPESSPPERSQRPVWLGQDRRGWDHARIHRQVLEDKRLGAYEVGVYVGLAMHAETMSGECFPAEATLAAYLGCSDRQVRRALVTLRDANYIETDGRPGKATVYRLLPPPTTASTLDSQSGVWMVTPDSQSDHPGQTVQTTPDSQSDELEPLNENQEQPPPTPCSTRRVAPVVEEETATPDPIDEAARLHAQRAFQNRTGAVDNPAAWKRGVRLAWLEEFSNEAVAILAELPDLDGKALLGRIEHQPSDGLGYTLTGCPETPVITDADRAATKAIRDAMRESIPTARKREAS